jgi:Maintenance of mitochondrial morphology protein 1
MVIEFESDLINPRIEKSLSDYILSIYIQQDTFVFDFSVGSLLGHYTKVKDLPKLTDLITHGLRMAVANELVYPKGLRIPLKF